MKPKKPNATQVIAVLEIVRDHLFRQDGAQTVTFWHAHLADIAGSPAADAFQAALTAARSIILTPAFQADLTAAGVSELFHAFAQAAAAEAVAAAPTNEEL